MPCLLVIVLLGMPRLALFLTWLFSPGYLGRAYESLLWPVLGFFFVPTTTLAFAYASNSLGPAGVVPDLGWLLVALGLVVDLGLSGGSYRTRGWRRVD
jgi:hypothetical protein